ncbi:type VI secretion system baseplate subunit TssG [Pusillimonas sp. SM2304]|uniref:type VI secretion system baseplate subunit TssG n=1 Tax=Pusillimonas sp. SM2304 TaxID=3073241 RepID=UPI002874A9F8|nr:type VI secretion system baseplate subunit TssG [Pusillimonas sp. SM2304]MDS1139750.1 type VI secretion system baseplate subunit TssG [Pusillimonas sp. SM2304]
MAREDRPLSPSVADIDSLLDNGSRYAFFQALRLLRLRLGVRDFAQAVRVRPALKLSFPENDIDAIAADGDKVHITANFFGLYGVTSPLPTFYTEDLIDEQLAGGSSSRDFLDILHAKLYPMLFKAWEKNRIWLAVAERRDPDRLNQLMAMVGLQQKGKQVPGIGLQALLPHAGNFNQSPRSALGLEALVSGLLDSMPVDVEPCVSREAPIPVTARTVLGQQACALGENALLGRHVTERSSLVIIHIGPIPAKQLSDLLPGGRQHERLTQAIGHYVDTPVECVLGLRVATQHRQRVALGHRWHRLGLNTWLPEAVPGDAASPGRSCDEIFLPVDTDTHRLNTRASL